MTLDILTYLSTLENAQDEKTTSISILGNSEEAHRVEIKNKNKK